MNNDKICNVCSRLLANGKCNVLDMLIEHANKENERSVAHQWISDKKSLNVSNKFKYAMLRFTRCGDVSLAIVKCGTRSRHVECWEECVCSKYKFDAQSLEVTCINNVYDEKIYSRRITHNNVTLDA